MTIFRRFPRAVVLLALALGACRPVPPPPAGLVEAIDLPEALPHRDAEAARERLAEGDAEWEARGEPGAVPRARAAFWRAALSDPSLYEAYWKAARACAAAGEAETAKAARADAFERGSGIAALALELEPERAEAHYYYGINLGLLANERRSIAHDAVKTMIEHLERAAGIEPGFDHGGPFRTLALVYARAPKWPVSVGDSEAAVENARLAVEQSPDYPPNLLALAEALADDGASAEAAETLAGAEDRIRSGDWPEWQREAFASDAAALRRKVPASP